jgi:transcriptional regulator with XRE-family HTH domain
LSILATCVMLCHDKGGQVRIEEIVGANMRSVREGAGMTQEELGRQLGQLLGKEWSRQAVSAAEKGGRAFTAAEVVALAFTMNTTAGRLFLPPPGIETVHLSPSFSVAGRELLARALPNVSASRIFTDMLETLKMIWGVERQRETLDDQHSEAMQLLAGQLANAIEAVALRGTTGTT